MRTYEHLPEKADIKPTDIFVFGSNTEGRHGKGAALWAKDNAKAIYGQAKGLQGQSYAVITKDLTKHQHPSVSASFIISQIQTLYLYASRNSHLEFYIIYGGASNDKYLNGYTPQDMAQMFIEAGDPPLNFIWEFNFATILLLKTRYKPRR